MLMNFVSPLLPDAQVPLARIAIELDSEARALLSSVCFVLPPPIDAPNLTAVLHACATAIAEYGKGLPVQDGYIRDLEQSLVNLHARVLSIRDRLLQPRILKQPLYRRLGKSPGWSLFLTLDEANMPIVVIRAIGGEFALALKQRRRFSVGFAATLRRANLQADGVCELFTQPPGDKKYDALIRKLKSVQERADAEFRGEALEFNKKTQGYDEVIAQYLRRRCLSGTVKHRQAVLSWETQTWVQIIESGKYLYEQAMAGDPKSISAALSFLTGTPLALTLRIPIVSIGGELSPIQIDLEAGVIITDLNPMFPDAACPSDESKSAHHNAERKIVKPLPDFLANLIRAAKQDHPGARTLEDILFVSDPSSRQATTLTQIGRRNPSITRFLKSAAPFIVQAGEDRAIAAALTNDFFVTPGSKFYYTTISRVEIWQASARIFNLLGWGVPVDFVVGPVCGSQVTPTDDAVVGLFVWLQEQIKSASLGRNMGVEKLIEFHNIYARAVSSLLIFVFCARVAKTFKFTADMMLSGTRYICLGDKSVGHIRESLPVPITSFAEKQAQLWRAHCASLNARLEKNGVPDTSVSRLHLRGVVEGNAIGLLFELVGNRVRLLGSHDVSDWWPSNFGFAGNFGRHYWQRKLKEMGIPSSAIDAVVRHEVGGIEHLTSTGSISLGEWMNEITTVMDDVINELKIQPLAGLSRRAK